MPEQRKGPAGTPSPEDLVMEQWRKAQEAAEAGGPPVPQALIDKVFDIVTNPDSRHYDREETQKIRRSDA